MKVQYCPKCLEYYGGGYFKRLENYTCLYCESKLVDLNIEKEDFNVLWSVSQDNDFLQQMIELKEKDPIEFQLKMQQFRTQTAQQEQLKKQESSKNVVKCPVCKSTNIQLVKKNWSLLTGFMTNKVDRVCVNCKHKF